MSDRIKRMQNVTPELLNDFPNAYCEDVFWAVARIEELEAKLDWVIVERDETFALMLDRAQTAEAKLSESEALLAKAVEIGDKMAASIEGNYYLPGVATNWRKLTGGNDD